MKTYVFFNPASGKNRGEKKAHELDNILTNRELTYLNIITTDIPSATASLSEEDEIILCGGDGTINSFINTFDTDSMKPSLYLYPSGSGNDFLTDIGHSSSSKPVYIGKYIKNLPVLTVNGKKYKFINGAGAGIDGYACEECNRIRREKNKKASYVGVALKGILKSFTPLNAKVIADGKEYHFERMWLTPVMKGRYCGSGLKLAPDQNRDSGKLTFLTAHNTSRLKLLTILPTAYSGKHINFRKNVTVIEGKNFSVEFDRPTTLQLDGETISDVLNFTVSCDVSSEHPIHQSPNV